MTTTTSVSTEPEDIVLPSREDTIARGATGIFGGPVGRRARIGKQKFWTPLRVVILLSVVMTTLGWFQKEPCRTHPWGRGYEFTNVCYTDVLALYYAEGLADGQKPYVDHPVEYPVGIGIVMETVRRIVLVFPHDDRAARFLDITMLLLAAAAVVTVVATALTNRRRPWDAAMVALSPALIFHLGMNWDMFAAVMLALAILAWSRERLGWAGIALGIATATKFYPGLLLFPLLLLCFRSGQLRAFWKTTVATIGAAAAVYIPFWITSPAFSEVDGKQVPVAPSAWQLWTGHGTLSDVFHALAPHHGGGINGVYRFFDLNSSRPADWNSVWFMLQTWSGKALDNGFPSTLNLLTFLLFVVLLGGIAWLTVAAPRRPRLGQLVFLTVLAFLLTSKVWSPQYVIWLVPLAVLARPRWRLYLIWQASEVAMLIIQFLYFVNRSVSAHGVTVNKFLYAVIVRDVILIIFAVQVIREILHPERDVVRADGSDDPAGGVLDGAPDRESLAIRRSAAAGTVRATA